MGPRHSAPVAPPVGDTPATRGDHALLYDGDCPLCRWSLARVLAWDRRGRLRPVAIQSDEGQRLLAGLDEFRRLDSWHLVRPGGQLLSAGTAAAPLARLLPGGRPLAALFSAFPRATEAVYRWVSRHRSTLARLLRIDTRGEVPG